MTRKNDCRKCVHCKKIVTGTSIYRVQCNPMGPEFEFMPNYCDEYLTEIEYLKRMKKELEENGRN